MADISQEIQAFKDAVYGEEVRNDMISLCKKVNHEVENNTTAAAQAVASAYGAAVAADIATGAANTAAINANNAAVNAAAVRQDILNRLSAGEFEGAKGDTGDQGPQGESGIMAPSSGMFSLHLDPATGNLYVDYPDGEVPPSFEYEESTGKLYYLTE